MALSSVCLDIPGYWNYEDFGRFCRKAEALVIIGLVEAMVVEKVTTSDPERAYKELKKILIELQTTPKRATCQTPASSPLLAVREVRRPLLKQWGKANRTLY